MGNGFSFLSYLGICYYVGHGLLAGRLEAWRLGCPEVGCPEAGMLEGLDAWKLGGRAESEKVRR
jgi:hypothetical protein